MTDAVTLTAAECEALYVLLSALTGDDAGGVFAWDGSDSLADPATSACAKVFRAAGKRVPDGLEPLKTGPLHRRLTPQQKERAVELAVGVCKWVVWMRSEGAYGCAAVEKLKAYLEEASGQKIGVYT